MSFLDEFQNEVNRQKNNGRCLHYASNDSCNSHIAAHSIQKSGQLSLISENGHVYRISGDRSDLNKTGGLLTLKKIGINKVSTFNGFCGRHDQELFKPIDRYPLSPSKTQLALYSYRCLCREYFVKENAATVLENVKNHPELDNQHRQILELSQIGQNLGFEILKTHKKSFDNSLQNNDFDDFEYTYFISSDPCAIQASGLIYPDFDFPGRKLQNIKENTTNLDLITFFTAPTVDGWAFGFAWHSSSSTTCVPFIRSLAQLLHLGNKLEDALLRLTLSTCENHAIRISWWDNLDKTSKSAAISRMNLMAHPTTPIPHDYLASGCENLANWQYANVHSSI